jgi:hypothetical protein
VQQDDDMTAVPFDTLKMAQRLEAAGFSGDQAAGATEALAEPIMGMELVTKSDLHRGISSVRADLEVLRRDTTIKLGGMIFIAVGVLLAAMRYMPHP